MTKVQFMYGPSTRLFQISGAAVELGSIPNGSSVHFDVPSFRAQPLVWRVLVLLSGPATLLVLSALTLGFNDAWRHFSNGFSELLKGAAQPTGTAQQLISGFHEIYRVSFLQATGVLATKIAAFSLLPALGPAFVHIAREIVNKDEHQTLQAILTLHAWVLFLISGVWAFAMVRYAIA